MTISLLLMPTLPAWPQEPAPSLSMQGEQLLQVVLERGRDWPEREDAADQLKQRGESGPAVERLLNLVSDSTDITALVALRLLRCFDDPRILPRLKELTAAKNREARSQEFTVVLERVIDEILLKRSFRQR